ncbi:MAG: hypothetical protein ACR2HG_09535 [Pyrinomonadaceae bacterium]
MNQKPFITKTSLIAFAVLLFVFTMVKDASAQMDEVVIVKEKARNEIRPKAKPAPRKIDIVKRVSIVRVEKKSRKNYKKSSGATKQNGAKKIVRKFQAPLLAIQLKLLLVNRDGSESEVNPIATFTPLDRLRLSVKANQRGFLYIIRQKSPEEDGEIIFPTTLVNGGSNLVSANYEYVIPNNCPKDIIKEPRECSLTLVPYEDAPREYFTLIFTRDQLVGLPDDVKNTRVSLANLMSAGRVQSKMLVDLIEDSKQDLVSQAGDTPFGVRIVNQNLNDNEEIIETFIVNKLKK